MSCLVLELVRDLKLVAFYRERKHIYVGFWIVVVVMPVDQLYHNILTSNSLVELDIPFDGAQVLIAPEHGVAVHAFQI